MSHAVLLGSLALSSLDILQLPQSSLDVVHSESQDVLVFFLLGHAHCHQPMSPYSWVLLAVHCLVKAAPILATYIGSDASCVLRPCCLADKPP